MVIAVTANALTLNAARLSVIAMMTSEIGVLKFIGQGDHDIT